MQQQGKIYTELDIADGRSVSVVEGKIDDRPFGCGAGLARAADGLQLNGPLGLLVHDHDVVVVVVVELDRPFAKVAETGGRRSGELLRIGLIGLVLDDI